MEETHCVPFLVIIKQSEMGLIIFPCYLPKNKAKVPPCYMILESRHISTSKTYNCPKYQRLIIFLVVRLYTEFLRKMSWNGFVNDEDEIFTGMRKWRFFYDFMTGKYDEVRIS